MIPKIIHQTWKSRSLLPHMARWNETFKQRMPDWELRFWDDDACLALITEKFPQHLPVYHALKNKSLKADFFRYVAIHTFGGMYADIDCECLQTLDFITPKDELILAYEIQTQSQKVMDLYRSNLKEVFCCWAFMASPGHPVFADLIEDIAASHGKVWSEDPIVDGVKRTGPHAFTRAVERFVKAGGKPTIIPGSYFGCCDTTSKLSLARTWFFPTLFRKVYIRHHFETCWMDAKTKKEFIRKNLSLSSKPKPEAVTK